MLLEGDILALPSVKFHGAVKTLGIVVAVGGGFEEEAGASKLSRSDRVQKYKEVKKYLFTRRRLVGP
jgi:hypothetical protein